MNGNDFLKLALKLLEQKKEMTARTIVINENNVRISGKTLEDAGVVGAKAFSAKGLNDECNHSSVEWRLREDGWGAALCRRCGVNLSKYFGAKKRSSAPAKESTHNKSHGDASARPMDIVGQRAAAQDDYAGKKRFATWDKDGAIKKRYENPDYSVCAACRDPRLKLMLEDYYACATCEKRTIGNPSPAHDYAGAHLRDVQTPDDRRPRVSLRTDAQDAHDRAVKRLRQHKLARWGRAESVDWEDEQS